SRRRRDPCAPSPRPRWRRQPGSPTLWETKIGWSGTPGSLQEGTDGALFSTPWIGLPRRDANWLIAFRTIWSRNAGGAPSGGIFCDDGRFTLLYQSVGRSKTVFV